jgi:hypothetical protein
MKLVSPFSFLKTDKLPSGSSQTGPELSSVEGGMPTIFVISSRDLPIIEGRSTTCVGLGPFDLPLKRPHEIIESSKATRTTTVPKRIRVIILVLHKR